jgi:hypothetical protein
MSDDRSQWYPGRRVRVKQPHLGLAPLPEGPAIEGIITKVRPKDDMVFVQPDRVSQSFGWFYSELELLPIVIVQVWNPGRRVRVRTSSLRAFQWDGLHLEGTITEDRPQNNGVFVQPDGLSQSFGWDYSELELLPPVIGPSVWERLRALREERLRERENT